MTVSGEVLGRQTKPACDAGSQRWRHDAANFSPEAQRIRNGDGVCSQVCTGGVHELLSGKMGITSLRVGHSPLCPRHQEKGRSEPVREHRLFCWNYDHGDRLITASDLSYLQAPPRSSCFRAICSEDELVKGAFFS